MNFKLLAFVIIFAILFTSCSPTATPIPLPTATLSPTNTSTPEPSSTLAPTNTPNPTKTPRPTNTPKPTSTRGPASTPNPNTIAYDFIRYYKDNFQFYAKKLTPKVEVELTKFAFEYDGDSDLNLILETKSGEVVLQADTPLLYSVTMLASDLEKSPKLPGGIKEVLFTFRNNDLEIRQQAVLDWEVLIDYVENDITTDQLIAAIRKP